MHNRQAVISIHTTRKVVTAEGRPVEYIGSISIHTTRKVVTASGFFCSTSSTYFNPHHPQGGDK